MFFGINCFGDIFENKVIIGDLNYLELSDGKFDAISITKNINDDSNVKDDTWKFEETIFITDFSNTVSSGNIISNMGVNFIKIKRRKIGNPQWEDLKLIVYESNKISYSYIDNFVEALEQYEYTIQPIALNGALGSMQSKMSDMIDFDGAWLVTEDELLHCIYNLEIGDYDFYTPSSVVESLGYEHPFVMTNGMTRYRTGDVKCYIISDSTISRYGDIDRKAEKIFRNKIFKFLTDKKPKVYKDSSGEYMVVAITGEPRIVPINELNQKIYELNFSFVEVRGNDLLTLHHTGIIK